MSTSETWINRHSYKFMINTVEAVLKDGYDSRMDRKIVR